MCDICGAKCLTQQTLKRHVKTIHEGKKPFKCDICDVCFGQNSSLKRHISSVHEEKTFDCDRCGAKFAIKQNLKRHGNCSWRKETIQMWHIQKSGLNKHISSIHEKS